MKRSVRDKTAKTCGSRDIGKRTQWGPQTEEQLQSVLAEGMASGYRREGRGRRERDHSMDDDWSELTSGTSLSEGEGWGW